MALTNDYDVEYDGTLLVDGDTRLLVNMRPFTMPPIRVTDQVRGQQDGLFVGRDLYGGRTIDMVVEVWGETESAFRTSYQDLLDAVVLRRTEKVLKMRLPEWTQDLRSNVKPRRVSGPVIDVRFDHYVGVVNLQFFSTDPRLYDDTEQTDTAGLPTSEEGMEFNATFNLVFGAVSASNSITANNAGNYETPWTATITGPVDNPKIQHVGQNKTIELVGSVGAGETLVVSSPPTSTVLLNGTSSRYSWLQDTEQWFLLDPGDNEIRFLGSSAGSPTLELAWRSAWV